MRTNNHLLRTVFNTAVLVYYLIEEILSLRGRIATTLSLSRTIRGTAVHHCVIMRRLCLICRQLIAILLSGDSRESISFLAIQSSMIKMQLTPGIVSDRPLSIFLDAKTLYGIWRYHRKLFSAHLL